MDDLANRRLLRRLSTTSRLLFLFLFYLAARLPLFDASPLLVPTSPLAAPLLRWDLFHFLHVAQRGYVYEHEWAFFPGASFLMHYSGALLDRLAGKGSVSHLLLGGATITLACDTTQTLYDLSLHHLRAPKLALLASILSLLPTSPTTLYFAPYNEPFFTYFSYRGMLYSARQQWTMASISFALASTFRSNGIFLSGFILWGLLVQPFLLGKLPNFWTLLKAVLLTATVMGPFISYHIFALDTFCSNTDAPEWCTHFPPSTYTYIQSKYWNVGFLRYWTLSQLPNFLIAAPTFISISSFAIFNLRGAIPRLVHRRTTAVSEDTFRNASIVPHAIHATVFACILLFSSHVQIILRVGASMPLTYWAAAWLLSNYTKWGRLWVTWSILWGIISVLLWGAFLPPA